MVTSNGFRLMIYLFIIEQYIYTVFMFDSFFDYDLFNTFSSLIVFVVVFNI